jgi:uncharacterized protein (DUF4415 family)
MQKPRVNSKTDWARVKREADADAPIPFNPEDEFYNPNNDAEVEAFTATAIVRRPRQRGPQKAPTKEMISIRLSREVLDHFRATGEGWQSRIDETLKKAIRRRK